MESECDISILIRTRNVETHLWQLLVCLSNQTIKPSEIVIIDNYSSVSKLDEMVSLLKVFKRSFGNSNQIKLVPVDDDEFSYSYTANIGISVAENELVCITNGHCIPSSMQWIEYGISHFKCKIVAGVAGYTFPHKEGTIWEKFFFNWCWRIPKKITKSYSRDQFFSTTNCILRKSFWKEYVFDEEIYTRIPETRRFGGEDYDWALEMLSRGYEIVVEPKFDVFHSHGDNFSRLLTKYLAWRRIRRKLRNIKRPRKSYTYLAEKKHDYKAI